VIQHREQHPEQPESNDLTESRRFSSNKVLKTPAGKFHPKQTDTTNPFPRYDVSLSFWRHPEQFLEYFRSDAQKVAVPIFGHEGADCISDSPYPRQQTNIGQGH
jgi:hypothetical protein